MTQLIDYWPTSAAVNDCIRTEAEVIDDAVLLAVHEPMLLKSREVGTGTDQTRSEQDLLDAFMTPAEDGSAVVVAITGDSGVGKSHMIRWLYAQLQRHPRRAQLVVVVVPKTASLRQVVERILAPLQGAEYDRLRHDLDRVTQSLGPEAAAQHLATALSIELRGREQQWIAELQGGNASDRSLRAQVSHARGLQKVLFQHETFEHWLKPVLLRIVEQTLRGGSEASTGEARRFLPTDLQVPDTFDITIASMEAQRYIQELQNNEGAGTSIAARVLQDALDPAIRSVFRFSEALGQRTIEEVVNDIRARLLLEGKELVLLIEDFAALAGIQETLLNLMIAESDHAGKKVRAPLRTALAVTDGFLPSRQTILTRAKREWVIPNAYSSEDELLQRLTRMAGRYLNAARWGLEALREQYRNSRELGLSDWVKSYRVDLDAGEADCLRAFASSERGDPLFPLSPLSVRALARRSMTVDGKLLFNPRKFINAVLREVLLRRGEQLAGNFPPPLFLQASLRTDADLELRAQGHPESTRNRLIPVLSIWAGDPRNLTENPKVSRELFTAFGLPWPFAQDQAVSPPSQPIPQEPVAPRTIATDDQTRYATPPPVIGTPGMEADLESWSTGSLAQNRASRLRNVLATALNQRTDWNALRMAYGSVKSGFFWLPFAQVGNPTAEPKIVVAAEVHPVPATIRRGLLALDRWDFNGNHWDYPRAEDDYAYAQALLDQLEQQTTLWFVQLAQRKAALLGRTLHRQALLLGLSKVAEPAKPRFAELVAPAQSSEFADLARNLPNVGQVISLQDSAIRSREALSRQYLECISCFQGDGGTPYALDYSRASKAWKAREEANESNQMRMSDRDLATAVSELSHARLGILVIRYATAVKSLLPSIAESAGTQFDGLITDAAKATISNARRMGALANHVVNMAEVERSLSWLDSARARELIRKLGSFSEPDSGLSLQAQLAAWATLDVPLLAKTHGALACIVELLQATQREANAQLRAAGGGDAGDKMASLIRSLRDVEANV